MNRRQHRGQADWPSTFKYREGERRSPRFNEWYVDQKAHSEADRYFADHKGGVPNNPANAASFSDPDNVVLNHNPYGDADRISTQESPVLTRPDQRGGWFNTPEISPKAAMQGSNVGWGSGPEEMGGPMPTQRWEQSMAKVDKGMSRGMSTGMAGFGNGPQRNVERPRKSK